jgi:hypothetical protein
MDLSTLMDELFRRAAAADVDGVAAMCAPGIRFKQNSGDDGDLAALLELIGGIAAAGVTVSYTDVRRVVGDRSVAEQHLATLQRADGVEAKADVCVIVRFDAEGRVERVDEYFDPSPFGDVLG